MERKTKRVQSNFNDRMLRTMLNQTTRDRCTVMSFIGAERDDQKREKLWNIYRHCQIFIEIYDGSDHERRKSPQFYRSCQVLWKLLADQKEGGRKIFVIETSSPCYGFNVAFYSYQITIKGVTGNHLGLLEPYMEHLEARNILGESLNAEPIVPFSPLSEARLQAILNITEDPEPSTRDESTIGQPIDETSPDQLVGEVAVEVTSAQPDDGFETDSNGSWFDKEANNILAHAHANTGNPIDQTQTIGYNRDTYVVTGLMVVLIGIAIRIVTDITHGYL